MKKALITGIGGQDGSYLSEHLLSLGYEVYGIFRRHSVAENQNYRLHHIKGNDRFALLMEHMENLIFDDEDAEEILWVKNLVCEEEEK